MTLFNEQCHREFYSNKDYIFLGGRENELDYHSGEEENSKFLNITNSTSKLNSQPNQKHGILATKRS